MLDSLQTACSAGDIQQVKWIVQNFDFMYKFENLKYERIMERCNDALVLACKPGHLEIVRFLWMKWKLTFTDLFLTHGCMYKQALREACRHKHLELVKFLYNKEGVIDRRVHKHLVQLSHGSEAIIEFLTKEGVRRDKLPVWNRSRFWYGVNY
jgi:hypothetical protein